jgi:flavin reductase (DIM6/NTAB) family NADH-FMN oxidoreductase RutF
MDVSFETLRRQQFRRYFQPSRILLGVVPAPTESSVNVITLSFSMHCSYQPPMLAIAINDKSSTFELIKQTSEYVLAVPGPTLLDASMYCGVVSMRQHDKVKALALELTGSATISVPGLKAAIANVEMRKTAEIKAGDHLVVIGEALRFAVNKDAGALPLLSVGPYTDGYEVLRKKGIHRLGTVRK